jgi:hypothetical protein
MKQEKTSRVNVFRGLGVNGRNPIGSYSDASRVLDCHYLQIWREEGPSREGGGEDQD